MDGSIVELLSVPKLVNQAETLKNVYCKKVPEISTFNQIKKQLKIQFVAKARNCSFDSFSVNKYFSRKRKYGHVLKRDF